MTSAYNPRTHMDKITAEAAELAALLGDQWTIEGNLGQSLVHRTKVISVSLFGGTVSYRRAGTQRRSLFADVTTPAELAPWLADLASVADPVGAPTEVHLIAIDDPEGVAGVEAQRAAEYGDTPRTEYVVQLGYGAPSEREWVDSRYSPHGSEAAGRQQLGWLATHHGTDATALRFLVRVTSETVIESVTL